SDHRAREPRMNEINHRIPNQPFRGQRSAVPRASLQGGPGGHRAKARQCALPIRPGRGWLKVKRLRRQELVVGDWRPPIARGRVLASLLLGYYAKGKLIYAGSLAASPFVDLPALE